jgi:enediyne biosynthesis protein E4
MANFLLRNDGTGKFAEVAALAGTALDLTGKAQASMGVDAADFDNDGRMDFHVTSYSGEFSTLYRNFDGQLFEDATRTTGAGEGTFPHVTWGNAFADFDNDSHRDIFIACGHLDDNFHLRGGAAGTAFDVPNVVLRNLGNRRFQNVSASSGDGLKAAYSSRGVAIGDLDGNGSPDVVVLNTRQPPTLLRNDTSAGNHWLAVRLIGRDSNRSGVGASVTVHLEEASLFDEVRSGRGYQSHFGEWLHFGLGSAAHVQKLVVTWPGGRTFELTDIPLNAKIVVREGDPTFVPMLPRAVSR